MLFQPSRLDILVDEYETIRDESFSDCLLADEDAIPWDAIEMRLVQSADWTPTAAQHLLSLVRDYGAFVLRNAAALAIALDIEDGELGL